MPGFDGTGPAGMGSMTGWGRGYCNPSQSAYGPAPAGGPGYGFPGQGRRSASYGRGFGGGRGFRGGFARGQGFGRGFGRRGAYPSIGARYGPVNYGPYDTPYAMPAAEEADMLRNEAEAVKQELDTLNKRIEELESKSSGN